MDTIDPVAAKQFVDGLPEKDQPRYCPTLVRNWAAYDPDAAREWGQQIVARVTTEGDEWFSTGQNAYGEIMAAWVRGYLEHDRTEALNEVLHDDGVRNDNQALAAVIETIFVDSPDDTRQFIEHLSDKEKENAFGGLNEVVTHFSFGDAGDRIRSPEFVGNWLIQFPDEPWGNAMNGVLREWRYKDINEMFSWMEQLPPAIQHTVASQYDPYLNSGEVGKEFAMIIGIPNVALRDQLLEQVVHGYGPRDQVLAALEQAPLPAEQKDRLTEFVNGPDFHDATSESTEDD